MAFRSRLGDGQAALRLDWVVACSGKLCKPLGLVYLGIFFHCYFFFYVFPFLKSFTHVIHASLDHLGSVIEPLIVLISSSYQVEVFPPPFVVCLCPVSNRGQK